METGKEKKDNKPLFRKLFPVISVALCLIVVVGTVTYSWIRRDWTPSITGTNIKITSQGSLVFSMEGGDSENTLSTLLPIGGKNPELKAVSSVTGKEKEFWRINYLDDSYPKYELITDTDSTEKLITTYGMISLTFKIESMETASQMDKEKKYLFLSPTSYVSATDENGNKTDMSVMAEQSLRVAIETSDGQTLIFRSPNKKKTEKNAFEKDENGEYILETSADGYVTTHTGISMDYIDDDPDKGYKAKDARFVEGHEDAYIKNGKAYKFSDKYGAWEKVTGNLPIYDEKTKKLKVYVGNQLDGIAYYNGKVVNGYVEVDETLQSPLAYKSYYQQDRETGEWYYRNPNYVPNANNPTDCITTFSMGSDVQVSLRIWIEGTDPNCTADIRNAVINLSLVFDSIDV